MEQGKDERIFIEPDDNNGFWRGENYTLKPRVGRGKFYNGKKYFKTLIIDIEVDDKEKLRYAPEGTESIELIDIGDGRQYAKYLHNYLLYDDDGKFVDVVLRPFAGEIKEKGEWLGVKDFFK